MKNFFRKLKSYGFYRAFLYILLKVIQKARAYVYRYILSDNRPILKGVKLNQPAQFLGKGIINLQYVNVGVWPSPNFLDGYAYFEARNLGASIEIDEDTCLNNGASIIADKSKIKIGKRCLIGLRFSVVDSDFHGIDIINRSNGCYDCAEINIGDDVFIGNDVKILKGVEIGRGSIIGSGSLVIKNVPEMTIYAGVPAKFIRNI